MKQSWIWIVLLSRPRMMNDDVCNNARQKNAHTLCMCTRPSLQSCETPKVLQELLVPSYCQLRHVTSKLQFWGVTALKLRTVGVLMVECPSKQPQRSGNWYVRYECLRYCCGPCT